MYLDGEKSVGEATSQERRDATQDESRILGHVVQCDGARATIHALARQKAGSSEPSWAVGRLISINLGAVRTVGLVYAIAVPERRWHADENNSIEVSVELIGEVRDREAPLAPLFDRGITQYPYIGAIAHRIRSADLQAVYDLGGRRSITLGNLSQDGEIEAKIAIEDTLTRHFAFVGTTGVGKSTAVSLLLRKTITACPDLRVLIFDPHNEFGAALPEHSVRIDTGSLDLPFWLFRLEEMAEVIFRGREPVAEEVELLRDLIPLAKTMFRASNSLLIVRRGGEGLTADTPLPYRATDLIKLIDDRIGQLDAKTARPVLKSLRSRLESALNDPRYRFMFGSGIVDDNLHETIGRIFRLPHGGRPITCFEMAGLPSEVVNATCSVLARLAFDLAAGSDGRMRLLLLCEEAHRYMPADARLGFGPTRHALARIAKEGRKYGCFLGVVTQRPGELDPTILSQCSTVFAMRLANEQDQAIIRSAIADSSASTLTFLSSIGQREAIAFGEGVAATMRLHFEKLPASLLPGRDRYQGASGNLLRTEAEPDIAAIIDNMRKAEGFGQQQAFGRAPLPQRGDPPFPQEEGERPASRPQDVENLDLRFGLKPSTFGMKRF